jgi:ATP-dependent RNA helicase SUPV3L1/SUV3
MTRATPVIKSVHPGTKKIELSDTPESHAHSLGCEIIKQEGRVLIRVSGVATSSELSVPYEIVPANGILANMTKWRNLSVENQLILLKDRLNPSSINQINEMVSDFVGSLALQAEKFGIDPLPFFTSLKETTIPANVLFSTIEQRLKREVEKHQEVRQAEQTKNTINLADYPISFNLASKMQRKFIALIGEPNSGKTYVAMQALAAAESGVYLAPLRLLALENYERLCSQLPHQKGEEPRVSLITGDERREFDGASHVASTVEMLNTKTMVDVAVIDEIQLLGDKERGAAWTAAVCGAPAKVVYLVGSVASRGAIESLAKRLNVPLEVHVMKRKAPLSGLTTPISKIKNLKKGDAVIAFSRRNVMMWRDLITEAGFSTAVIYGNLSPEVRRTQAERFVDGSADILIATDAIGMGLNLPIERVIFSATSKYNGEEDEELSPALAQQIAGRAGRYGAHEQGYFAGYDDESHKVLHSLMKDNIPAVASHGFSVSPSIEHLKMISQATGEQSLSGLLKLFAKNIDGKDGFFLPHINEEQAERALWLDTLTLSLADKFMMSLVPVSTNVESLRLAWEGWCTSLTKKIPCKLITEMYGRDAHLQDVEDSCKLYSAYAWLGYRMPEFFPSGEDAVRHSRLASVQIDLMLQKQNAAQRKASVKLSSSMKDATKSKKHNNNKIRYG